MPSAKHLPVELICRMYDEILREKSDDSFNEAERLAVRTFLAASATCSTWYAAVDWCRAVLTFFDFDPMPRKAREVRVLESSTRNLRSTGFTWHRKRFKLEGNGLRAPKFIEDYYQPFCAPFLLEPVPEYPPGCKWVDDYCLQELEKWRLGTTGFRDWLDGDGEVQMYFDVVQNYKDDPADLVAEKPEVALRTIQRTTGFTSASKWGEPYCRALKVHALLADNLWDVVPGELEPSEKELEFVRPFFELDGSQIRELATQMRYSESIRSLYRALSHVVAVSSQESVASGESQASKEQYKDEAVMVNFLNRYLDFVVEPFMDAGTLDATPMRLEVRPQPFAKGIRLGGVKVLCKTDGSLAVAIASGRKSIKTKTQTALFLECKRVLHTKRDDDIAGQLAAELISVAQYAAEAKEHANPEAFGILLHHRHAQIISAAFSPAYLDKVDRRQELEEGDFLAIKATEAHDMAIGEDRKIFTTIVVGLIKYLISGRARIGRLDELKHGK
ncbi:hypothetical protein HDU85_007822 [Gaertneriomyces sp. JEL0708]|nr:hypothetical protein HDU85_007822 [Gaertneriomyces sp. JEL0708]